MSNYNEYEFSVVIPLYNKAEYIKRCIDSILYQTYTKFEIIIIDDGSNDKGTEIVNLISDPRVRLYCQENAGVSAARNKGVHFAKYGLVAFIDADDIWCKGFLKQVNFLVNKYPEAAIYATNNYFDFGNGRKQYENYNELFNGDKHGIIEDYFKLFAEKGKSPFSNSNYAIKKDIFTAIGGYKKGVRLTEDSDLWCRVAIKYPIAYSIEPLAVYDMNTTGNTHMMYYPDEYEVTKTLIQALRSNTIKKKHIKSVKKLIAFQKLNWVKRSILTNTSGNTIRQLFNPSLAFFYPKDFLMCIIALVVPKKTILFVLKRKK